MLHLVRGPLSGRIAFCAILGIGIILSAAGCKTYPDVQATGVGYANPQAVVQPSPQTPGANASYNEGWYNQTIRATGDGAPPTHAVTDAQRRLMAQRAAVTDARRNLLEKIQGVYITSETTVRDFMTQSDRVRSTVSGIVAAATEDVRENPDGSFTATVSTDLSALRNTIPMEPATNAPPPGQQYGGAASGGQARAMASRAALLDAQRKLVEKIYGTYVQSETSVTNFQMDFDRIYSQSQGLLRWAREIDSRYNPTSGEAEVTLLLEGRYVKELVKRMKRMGRY